MFGLVEVWVIRLIGLLGGWVMAQNDKPINHTKNTDEWVYSVERQLRRVRNLATPTYSFSTAMDRYVNGPLIRTIGFLNHSRSFLAPKHKDSNNFLLTFW